MGETKYFCLKFRLNYVNKPPIRSIKSHNTMEESSKLQKLAAGRKKLKMHQQKRITKNTEAENVNNNVVVAGEPIKEETTAEQIFFQALQLQSYFVEAPAAATFFDDVALNASQNPQVPKFFINNGVNYDDVDVVTLEDPELQANVVQNYLKQEVKEDKIKTQTIDESNVQDLSLEAGIDFIKQEMINDPIVAHANENLIQLGAEIREVLGENAVKVEDCMGSAEENVSQSNTQKHLQIETLTRQMEHYRVHIAELEQQLNSIKIECDSKIRNELGPLESEVQTLRQTIGILVGEKTELIAELSHCQMLLKQKTTENEELTGRLKTSRSRVADIESELQILKEDKVKNLQNKGHDVELAKIQQELEKLHVTNSDMEQDLEEMRERFRKSQEELETTKSSWIQVQGKLDMANIKIQQLSTGGDALEKVVQEKLLLEKQILDLNAACQAAISERDQASSQYQQYVEQLNSNVTSLAQKLESTVIENENMSRREQDLIKHMGEMEKRLQNLQQETANNICKAQLKTEPVEVDKFLEENTELKEANSRLRENFEKVVSERDHFIEELESKKESIAELEALVERIKTNEPNNAQLLASIESEKVAASRAVEQNMILKQQLEEMQDAFIKMTNDKADLLNQLSTADYKTKELEESLSTVNHQLQTLTNAIEVKDRELTEIRQTHEVACKESLHQDQLNDRLRHYEAQERSLHVLQHQLQEAADEIRHLKLQNEELLRKMQLNSQQEAIQENPVNSNSIDVKKEINQTQSNKEKSTNTEIVDVDHQGVLHPNKEIAMQQLEKKFMNTMQQIANLQDEKQMLEHLVTQLQGETETIGEYIALYQHQRGILKSRAMEKEAQLSQLARDRDEVRYRLNLLNNLVRKLVSQENGGHISDEDLNQHRILSAETEALCEEHAKLHKEMRGQEPNNRNETAQQIMNLLGEIKNSNLVQPAAESEDLHRCPWCSGQLITV